MVDGRGLSYRTEMKISHQVKDDLGTPATQKCIGHSLCIVECLACSVGFCDCDRTLNDT